MNAMNSEIAQLVTLASAANGVISGCFDSAALYPSDTYFRFCNSVRFVDVKKWPLMKLREVERHGDPNEWLRSLAATHAVQAWLSYTPTLNPLAPDHMVAAFVGGGGEWKLVVSTQRMTETWMPRWEANRRDASDRRVWRVTYGCVARLARPIRVPTPDLELAASRLLSALTAAHEFASVHSLGFWADWFRGAADCLHRTMPVAFPKGSDLLCLESYPDIAQRLLAAAYSAWVFGGMGSWNDLAFEPAADNARYSKLSRELYSAVTDAIQQSSWSFRMTRAA